MTLAKVWGRHLLLFCRVTESPQQAPSGLSPESAGPRSAELPTVVAGGASSESSSSAEAGGCLYGGEALTQAL